MFGSNNINPYRLAMLAFLATTTVYTTNSTNNFVYLTPPTTAAAAAGYILLSIINIIWIFYLGTSDDTKFHTIIDSYSDDAPSHRPTSGPAYHHQQQMEGGQNHQLHAMSSLQGGNNNPFNRDSVYQPHSAMRQRSAHPGQSSLYGGGAGTVTSGGAGAGSDYPQMFMAAPLGGFENSSEFFQQQQQQGQQPGQGQQQRQSAGKDSEYARESHGSAMTTNSVATPTVYPYRARAKFDYTASPDDPNEISFAKDEILEISDKSGKWWQARRANNEVGICPSNYIELIDDDDV